MGRRVPSKGKRTASDGDDEAPQLIHTISSDDEEANEDLTLEIVEKSRRREAKRKKAEDGSSVPGGVSSVIEISPASSGERELASDANPVPAEGKAPALDKDVKKKKKKKPKKIKKKKQPEEAETTPVSTVEDQPMRTDEFVDNVANETSDNAVLRKLLRGPRYFDPGESNLSTCFNCGEEGHTFANCTAAKRDKPCFICGLFGHNSKQCIKEQACFVCKRSGHRAKDCPDKNKKIAQDTKFCLRCGDLGHDMLSCRNDYPVKDLKEIKCYICNDYGHLCCVDFMESGPREVFCHNCAESGHTGSGCAKTRGESNGISSPAVCYKCHQEGHFARGCASNTKPKSHTYFGDSSTPSKPSETYMDSPKFRSVPRYIGKTWKDTLNYEERRNMKTGKSRNSGDYSAHRQSHLHRQKSRGNPRTSATTPLKGSHIDYSLNYDEAYSNSWSPKKRKPLFRTPSSRGSQKTYKHESSASRFGGLDQFSLPASLSGHQTTEKGWRNISCKKRDILFVILLAVDYVTYVCIVFCCRYLYTKTNS